MKSLGLKGEKRSIGTVHAKKTRAAGKVPCVLYGAEENVHFSIDAITFDKFVYTPNVYQVVLDIDGKEYKAIIKDVQSHPVTDKAVHVDFFQLSGDKLVTIGLPVVLRGTSIGVKNGGKLRLQKRKLTVKALPAALPEDISVDITSLRIGQSIKVGDLQIAGLEFMETPNDVIVSVKTSRKVAVEEIAEEEAAEEGVEATEEAQAEA